MVQHVDPEILALIALGEDGPDVVDQAVREHLDACGDCAEEAADLAAVAETARTVRADELERPSPQVWERISTELGLGAGAVGASSPRSPLPALEVAPGAPVPAAPDGAPQEPGTGDVGPTRPPRPRSVRRHRPPARRRWGLAAAAASVALVAGVGAGIVWDRATTQDPPEQLVAQARLDALPDWPEASGEARIETAPDGRRQAVVTVDAPSSTEGYREVWLIADDLSALTSLGVLEGSEGRFDIPDDLDLAAFPLVDVSQEPLDGDPEHSGDSIVRGSLAAGTTAG